MKRKLIFIMLGIILLVSIVTAITYQIDYDIGDSATNDSVIITYHSDELGTDIVQNFESESRFNTCKGEADDKIWVVDNVFGLVLNFDCSPYNTYEDYLQSKMQENIDARTNTNNNTNAIDRIIELETEIANIKSCAKNSDGWEAYRTCIGGI